MQIGAMAVFSRDRARGFWPAGRRCRPEIWTPGQGVAVHAAAMLRVMSQGASSSLGVPAYLVEVGGLCCGPGEQVGEIVEVDSSDVFLIAAPGPAAAETAGMQLFHAAATRRRRFVRDPWARVRNGSGG
jgi:hypothetical protein